MEGVMDKVIVEGQEVILDDMVEDVYVQGYAIDKEGEHIEPDRYEERKDSTRAEDGVYRWNAIWEKMPDDALLVKIICKKNGDGTFERLKTPWPETIPQMAAFDALCEEFGLSFV